MKTKWIVLIVAVLLAFPAGSNAWASRDPLGDGVWINRGSDPVGDSDELMRLNVAYAQTPAEMRLGANLYEYCGNSPTNYIDPMGLDFQSWDSCFLGCLADNGWFELAASIVPGLPFNKTTYLGPRSKTVLGSTNPNTTMASDLQSRGYLSKGARAAGRVLNPVADAYAAYASARMLGIEIGCGIKCSGSCPKK